MNIRVLKEGDCYVNLLVLFWGEKTLDFCLFYEDFVFQIIFSIWIFFILSLLLFVQLVIFLIFILAYNHIHIFIRIIHFISVHLPLLPTNLLCLYLDLFGHFIFNKILWIFINSYDTFSIIIIFKFRFYWLFLNFIWGWLDLDTFIEGIEQLS